MAASTLRRAGDCVAVAGVVIAADQLTKNWAVSRLADGSEIHIVWTLRLKLTVNAGMAFSRGGSVGPVIGLVALAVAACLPVMAAHADRKLTVAAFGLVTGGALGNVIDRAFRSGSGFLGGRVIDFVDLQWWPVFNVADASIVVGGVLLVLSSALAHRRAVAMAARAHNAGRAAPPAPVPAPQGERA